MSTTPLPPLLSDEQLSGVVTFPGGGKRYEHEMAGDEVRDFYERARAKDAEEIAKWKGIVKGVHGALADIGDIPVPALDADLYDTVMSIRAKDAELIQRLVDCLQQIADEGHWTPDMDELLNVAAATGFKPSEP